MLRFLFFGGEKKTKRPFFLRSKALDFSRTKKKQKKNVPNNTPKVTHNTKKNELSKKVGVLENQYCDDDDDDVEARFLDPRRGSSAPFSPPVAEETTRWDGKEYFDEIRRESEQHEEVAR